MEVSILNSQLNWKELIAMKVDLLVKNGKVYNSYLKKFFSSDIAVIGDKFIYIGCSAEFHIDAEKVIDAKGMHIIPGLIDIHMHIESSMATPIAFSKEIIKNGVTTIVSEPHEIANVFGIEGILEMIKSGEDAEVDIFYGVPSSVPSTSSEYETTGGEIGIDEVEELMNNEKVICLGEVMNYFDVINSEDKKINKIIKYFKKQHPLRPIEGHCPRIKGLELSKLIFSGVTSDHTQQTVCGMEERIKSGMFIQIQEKSMVKPVMDYLIENSLYEHLAFVTDDCMADVLVSEGHLNKHVKKAINMGMSPENAIYCATYTSARRMNLFDRGSIAPGKLADFIMLEDLNNFKIDKVFKKGKQVYSSDDKAYEDKIPKTFPEKFYNSIKLNKINEDMLRIKAKINNGSVKCRVIKIQDGSTFTDEIIGEVAVKDGYLQWENSEYCLMAVIERYGKNQNIGFGLAAGDTIKKGAVAASYAHDHHNIIVVGKNARDIVCVVNSIIDSQGGYCAALDGKILAKIDLPIGGILSDKNMKSIGKELKEVTEAMRYLGYKHYNPIMSFSTNSLPVSPLLKITDKGLIKLNENRIVDIFLEE